MKIRKHIKEAQNYHRGPKSPTESFQMSKNIHKDTELNINYAKSTTTTHKVIFGRWKIITKRY